MTIKDIIKLSAQTLKKNGSSTPELDAELLLCFILGWSREHLFAHNDRKLTNEDIKRYKQAVERRSQGVPVSYITGRKSFGGLDFIVNGHVLVPRPETEVLIAQSAEHIAQSTPDMIIDLGTGSGCIIIKLLKELKNLNFSPLATDISPKALAVARENSRRHGVADKIKFLHGNLLEPAMRAGLIKPDTDIVILANLPYLSPAQIDASPSIQHEPRRALEAGPDGLRCYKKLFKQIVQLKKTVPGLKMDIFCEIDDTQGRPIKKLAQSEMGGDWCLEVKRDLGGYDRVLTVRQRKAPQIPNPKHQNPNKSQISNSKIKN